MGRLCQGMGKKPNRSGQRIESTDTLFVINYENIPHNRCKDTPYTSVVCKIRPQKEYHNRACITICGNNICYSGDVGTPTSYLELVKLIINSVIT